VTVEHEPDFGPVETLMQGILGRWFATHPEVLVTTEFYEGMGLPLVIARADRRSGTQAFHSTSDDRFMKPGVISVSSICEGPDADEMSSHLIESCRLALRRALKEQWVIPGAGHLSFLDNSTPATRVTDWATSTAVVQYSSLPKDAVRYEAIFRILYRPPLGGSGNPFLPVT
jgi:hypothetical protein